MNKIPNYNPILDADSYKGDHANQLPDSIKQILSVGVPRKGNKLTDEIVSLGLRYVAARYLSVQYTMDMIDEAEIEYQEQGYVFDRDRWENIVNNHGGYLPIEVRAVPEGTVVPPNTGTYFIKNLPGEELSWIPSWVETMVQRAAWKFTTVSTVLRSILRDMIEFAIETGTPIDHVHYALHNFGDRGADSHESAIIVGMTHLLFFKGTDCLQANRYLKGIYGNNAETGKRFGSSVIASEHMVMCANSDANHRNDSGALKRMLDRLEQILDDHDNGKNLNVLPIVSIVCDTYDTDRFVRRFVGVDFKDRIIELGKRGGKVVIRPDSGNATTVPVHVINLLMDAFGYTLTDKGFKQLPSFIGVIQGDGINQLSIRAIFDNMRKEKLAFGNIIFGMGGALTHGEGRDEFSFSQKATWMKFVNGNEVDLFKDPITDSGKRSYRGDITTFITDSGKIFTDRVSLMEINKSIKDLTVSIYKFGEISDTENYNAVRERAVLGLFPTEGVVSK